ncbi:isochorismatase family cysteine hydrolase [Dyadobacter subterraneus]|uniref:Cysteine hydrolase n=1 Tax=Dyadobacter subterraneus TaxID=2773304 RepID=A0ABR9W8Y1_9BACT|nr:isochorismatase family cysteine hydrolase [Dyadobacter subterraneus]MBE9461923.1 cysteine hydrolase [Dyadobacter subterraneus]
MKTTYQIDKTALVLVDVLNDFLADDGKLNAGVKPMIEKMDLKANLKNLISSSRQAGIKIVYAPHGLDEHSFENLSHVLPRMQWGKDNKVFWKDSKGADFYQDYYPMEGDIVAERHHIYNSFFNTDLDKQLRDNGIEYVVLAGFTSQTCVEGTGRHALESGYHVTFLTDGVAEFTERAQDMAIEISYPAFGHAVLTIAEFIDALKTSVA